jgi:colicin import membrane protein
MARAGVTYEEVEGAAKALLAKRASVTIVSVREELGRKGSPNTIHKHLVVWRSNRPKDVAPPVKLPEHVMAQLAAWVSDATAAAVAEANAALAHSQAESMELATTGESLEAERDGLLKHVAVVTTERDQALAQAAERGAEIERLTHEVDRERKLAGDAQIAAAQAQHKVESQTEHMTEMKAALQSLKATLESERNNRTEAEKRVAVLESERDAARREAKEALTAIAAERAATEKERENARSAAVENSALRAQVQAAEKLVARLEGQVTKYEAKAEASQAERTLEQGDRPPKTSAKGKA